MIAIRRGVRLRGPEARYPEGRQRRQRRGRQRGQGGGGAAAVFPKGGPLLVFGEPGRLLARARRRVLRHERVNG